MNINELMTYLKEIRDKSIYSYQKNLAKKNR